MQAMYYYANESGEPVGPIDAREIQRLARIGTIRPETLVIGTGESEWMTWSQLRSTIGEFTALPQQVEVTLLSSPSVQPSSVSPPVSQTPPPVPQLLSLLPQNRPSSSPAYQVKNLAVKLSLSGGLIGALTTNPANALQNTFDNYNRRGWRLVQVIHHSDTNLLGVIAKLAVLVLTFFLWTWSSAYILVFEKHELE